MNLIKYRPKTILDTFFDDSFGTLPNGAERSFEPRVDLTENEKDFRISLELPGLDKSDVKISIENDYLNISGEKKYSSEKETSTTWRTERRYGAFRRSFRLGNGVDQKKIDARFTNGVLDIIVPKSKESLRKEIEIKVN